MPSSASTRLRFEVQALGENLSTWGDTKLNEALRRLEEAIADVVPITMTAANYTLSSNNYIADEARGAVLNLSGTPGGTYQIIIPAVEKTYWVYNGTANDQTIGKSGGTTATVRAGRLTFVFCDGSTTYASDPTLDQIKSAAADVSLNSHKLTNVTDPTSAQDAATKHYVDVPTAARDMNGQKITTLGTPSAATDAATKGYIDTPTAARDMAGFKITTLGTPTAATDAATKGYIDTKTLDTFTAPAADLSLNSHKITSLSAPTVGTDAANKTYVDNFAFNSALPSGSTSGQVPVWNGTAYDLTTSVRVSQGGTGVTSIGTGVGTWLTTPSSANLAAALTDETGSGAAVFATSPTLVTPVLGTPTSGTLTNCTGLPYAGIASGALGSSSEYLLGTASKLLVAANVWTSRQAGGNTSTNTLTPDLSAGVNIDYTCTGNFTLGIPTNAKVGMCGSIRFTQDGTGSRTIAYNAIWKVAGGSAPALSTAASSIDVLFYEVVAASAGTPSLIYYSLAKAFA